MPSVIYFYLTVSAPWSNQHISLVLSLNKLSELDSSNKKAVINNENGQLVESRFYSKTLSMCHSTYIQILIFIQGPIVF